MYERNVIVLERYFNKMFGLDMKHNLKTNFKDYSELVECLDKYKNISEEEENIMQEYDSTANRIREVQKKQEILNKKNNRYQEERAEIFQNIDENADLIQKKIDNVNDSIKEINDEIKRNAQQFVEVIADFAEKTSIRTTCGKKRRTIENAYNTKLNETLDNYKEVDQNLERKAKQFVELNTEEIEEELKQKIKKNGDKEKIPFSTNVIAKAITLCVDIQKREMDILVGIYEKTSKLFTEIKNNTIKTDRHQKSIKDAKCKLQFLGAMKEYLVQFLDNERVTAVNGEKEHNDLMEEACKNLNEDLEQINNLYSLLLKEMSKKATKKTYMELYNVEYLRTLDIKAAQFDVEVKKLNLPVTILNPNYWRIEGMKKIYDVFYQCITEEYGKDLSEYMPTEPVEIPVLEEKENIVIEETKQEQEEEIEKEQEIDVLKAQESKNKKKNKEESVKSEIDRKLDMILGVSNDEEADEKQEKPKRGRKPKKKNDEEQKEDEINKEEQAKKSTKSKSNSKDIEKKETDINNEEELEKDETLEEVKDKNNKIQGMDEDEWDDEDEDIDEDDENWNDEDEEIEEEDWDDEDEEIEEDDDWDDEDEEIEEEDWDDEDEEIEDDDWDDEDEEIEEEEEDWNDEDEEIEEDEDWDDEDEEIEEDEDWDDEDEEIEEDDEDWDDEDDWDDDEDDDETEEDTTYFDIWGNDISKTKKNKKTNNKKEEKSNSIVKAKVANTKKKNVNSKKKEDDWENDFINIDQKDTSKRKKGFFDKFKK